MRRLSRGLLAILVALTAATAAAEPAARGARTVHNVAELRAALDGSVAPTTISLLAGDYPLDRPLVVPDGVLLEGVGTMAERDGRVAGFGANPVSVIRAAASFDGDLVTLGNDAGLRSLLLLDQTPSRGAALRQGNVVALVSRSAGDRLSARIEDCEIVSGGAMGVTTRGPVGHGIVVLTRSPSLGETGQPHVGSTVSLHLSRSRVQARGASLFVVNFASRSEIEVTLEGNLMAGPIVASGGASRPQLVSGSRVRLHSSGNLYQHSDEGEDSFGWMLYGGSTPHLPSLATPGPRDNELSMQSNGDRIEGFRIGVLAAGARRRYESAGPPVANRANLDLMDLSIHPQGDRPLGVALHGALSGEGYVAGPEFPSGEHNVLRVRMRSVRVDGPPVDNRYSDELRDGPTDDTADANRLVFAGTAADFARENPGFPPPPAELFGDGTNR